MVSEQQERSTSYTMGDVENSKNIAQGKNIEIIEEVNYYFSDNPELIRVLNDLHDCINNSTELSDDDKKEALEQVEILSKNGHSKSEKSKKACITALKILSGTLAGLSHSSNIIKSFDEILPKIRTLIGL